MLAAVWAGGEEARTIATTGGEALLAVADTTEAGLDWAMVRDWPCRMPNYSHGTAGIATALAVAGQALGRPDFVDAPIGQFRRGEAAQPRGGAPGHRAHTQPGHLQLTATERPCAAHALPPRRARCSPALLCRSSGSRPRSIGLSGRS